MRSLFHEIYLINQTPGEKLRHGVTLKASITPKPIRSLNPSPVDSCKLLDQLDRTKRNFFPRV